MFQKCVLQTRPKSTPMVHFNVGRYNTSELKIQNSIHVQIFFQQNNAPNFLKITQCFSGLFNDKQTNTQTDMTNYNTLLAVLCQHAVGTTWQELSFARHFVPSSEFIKWYTSHQPNRPGDRDKGWYSMGQSETVQQ